MITISSGHGPDYLLREVATGRENYYTGAVADGEPPGRWSGRGAEKLGLSGLVDHQDMTAVYERFIDPRDPGFRDPQRWDDAATLGHTGRRYQSEDEIYAAALKSEPNADAERRAELRMEASQRARKNVTFLDATFSVQKSITVLHTAFEAEEMRARQKAARLTGNSGGEGVTGGGDTTGTGVTGTGLTGNTGDVTGNSSGEGVTALHVTAGEGVTGEGSPASPAAAAEQEAAAWARHKQAVEDAIWAGNQAALEYLAEKTGYSRVGHHGGAAGRWIDAHDWTVASFFQHDNRDHEPHLHIHNAILNRVQGADGKWRTLDSKAIHKYRGAAAAVGERVMEEHLTRALGVQFAARPDGKAREIVGIEQSTIDLFSQRHRAITKKTERLVAAFETKFGRGPNSLELNRLQRSAWAATRKAKSHTGETIDQRLERVNKTLRTEISGGLRKVADNVLATRKTPKPGKWSQRAVIETALADVQETKAAWTEGDLTRAISNALPDHLGTTNPAQLTRLLEGLTAEALKLAVPLDAARPGEDALPDHLRLQDGESAYQARGARLYATPAHIHTERLLSAATARRDAPALSKRATHRFLGGIENAGIMLGADQRAALEGILRSGANVETLIGPAGTGKSFTLGLLAKAWQDPALWHGRRRRVIGLATSQIAAQVLEDEGLTASNSANWLAIQKKLDDGSTAEHHTGWKLRTGDLVVIDESAMSDTAQVAAIHRRCQAAGAKLLLTGDHRQLAAVGSAGAMDLIAEHGLRHELSETRRFTESWEGSASLRLRDRDTAVLREYHKHGRLVDGGAIEQTEHAATRAWLADRLAGRNALLVVDTNDQAARLSAQLRAQLVDRGLVAETGVPLDLQGTIAGVGDIVQARHNAWHLAKYKDNARAPINREQYRVVDTTRDGGLVVETIPPTGTDEAGVPGRMRLPGDYVREHVALGYASTVHAAQGLTVDTTHAVTSQRTGADAFYVAMSRGRERNTAYVVTRQIADDDAQPGETNETLHRRPDAVIADTLETAEDEQSALTQAKESAAWAESTQTAGELFADGVELATADRAGRWLDQLAADGHLNPSQREQMAGEDGATTLTTLLRRVELAGHDPQRVLRDAVAERSLDGARQITNVIHSRITDTTDLDPIGDTFTERVPHVENAADHAYLTELARAADERAAELGTLAAKEPPAWAVEALGPPPGDDEQARAGWEHRAGIVAAHREFVDHDDPDAALGQPPKAGDVEAYASWRAAWRALGRPEADRSEAELSNGQLHMRVRAYQRELAWAPPYVANELAGTRQEAEQQRHNAILLTTDANATDEETERDRLLAEAADYTQQAALLDERVSELEQVDEARAVWYGHTAATRDAARRAETELATRDTTNPDDAVADDEITAAQWLADHTAATRADDEHRPIDHLYEPEPTTTESSIEDTAEDTAAADDVAVVEGDVREVEPLVRDEDTVRVPTADETAAAIARAQQALAEIKRRHQADTVARDTSTAVGGDGYPDPVRTYGRDRDDADDKADGV